MPESAGLQAVADRQAITGLIYRYCRSVDRLDAALGYTIWHEGAEADYGPDVYQGSGRGFIDFVCSAHGNAVTHSHQVTNIILQLDGDRAASESYVTATLRLNRDGRLVQITSWGRYLDSWSRREGRWGIDKRINVIDFDELRNVNAVRTEVRARRDRTDPSYSVLRDPA